MSRAQSVFTLQRGSIIYHDDTRYVVIQILDLTYILAENLNTNEIKRLPISEIKTESTQVPSKKIKHIDALSDDDWQVAQQRLEIIQPLIHLQGRTKKDMEDVANKHGLHINTLYKWLKLYEENSLLTNLAPKKRSDSGQSKLPTQVEQIISDCIESEYLTKQKRSIASLHELVALMCKKADLPIPHVNTVRNRVLKLSDELKIKKRFGSKQAQQQFEPSIGKFPHAEYPLAVVQIDHTPTDIILVDEEFRLPIGRAWITMAIDVFSRMVTGFYISLDTPNAAAVGICLSMSILPKDSWLIENEIASDWPSWGLPRIVHADNAKEFRGNMLKKACDQYGINLEWRPVARPKFGAHIERLLGSFSKEIHALPGTTFSNIKMRGEYDSDKESAMTLREFEKWLAIQITERYHQRKHTGIGMPPLQKYEQGILGTKSSKGIGLPRRIEDELTLKLDFLPYFERTIQDYGARFEDIFYYHDVLRIWINSTVEGRSKLKRKFIFRYDPRDMSIVWFFDPQLETYYPIPYRNISFPAVSLWEIKAAREHLKSEGTVDIDEDLIFAAIEKMREIVHSSAQKTKKVRRQLARQKSSARKAKEHIEKPLIRQPSAPPTLTVNNAVDDDDIEPFDEMIEVSRHE